MRARTFVIVVLAVATGSPLWPWSDRRASAKATAGNLTQQGEQACRH
jgi:hypothetical protein